MLARRIASDISVLASYVRITRNSKNFPFAHSIAEIDRVRFEHDVTELISSHYPAVILYHTEKLPAYERERFSCQYALSDKFLSQPDAVFFEFPMINALLVINYIDHFRLGFVKDGFGFNKSWEVARPLLDILDERFVFMANDRYGYLSPRLKNCGLGLRLSVLVHLPGLDLTDSIGDTARMLDDRGYRLQAWNPIDDKDNTSHLFYLSSTINYGVSEEGLMDRFEQGVASVLEMEFNALSSYEESHQDELADTVFRSYGILRYSRKLTYTEALRYLSHVRMALELGHETPVDAGQITELFYQIMDGNLSKIAETDSIDSDVTRAQCVRAILEKGAN